MSPALHFGWESSHFPSAKFVSSVPIPFPSHHHHHNRFTALFPGPPGWAGARRELLDFMMQGKINRGRHTNHPVGCHSIRTNQCPPPSPIFLQAGCPSCCPIKALKAFPSHCAKFGWNQCSSFDNMQVLILCKLGLKMHIYAPKMGLLGFDPQNGEVSHCDPKMHFLVQKIV